MNWRVCTAALSAIVRCTKIKTTKCFPSYLQYSAQGPTLIESICNFNNLCCTCDTRRSGPLTMMIDS